jgi:hypothetical protein
MVIHSRTLARFLAPSRTGVVCAARNGTSWVTPSDPGRQSLAGVAFGRRFRRADFLGRLVAHPISVEDPRLVDALVSMGAVEVALRLELIRWQTRGTITVEVGQGSAEGWHGHAVVNGS